MASSRARRAASFVIEEEEEEDGDDERDMATRMSRLSVVADVTEGSDADSEQSDVDAGRKTGRVVAKDEAKAEEASSKPAAASSLAAATPWDKDYASETEADWLRPLGGGGGGGDGGAHRKRRSSCCINRSSAGGGGGGRRRERAAREEWLERAWQMKKDRHEGGQVMVVVMGQGKSHGKGAGKGSSSSPPCAGGGGVAMDMEEVQACKDLGLELPGDLTVEIPCNAATDTTAAGGSWPISGPVDGNNPNDVKERLKVWAQVVALTSASRLGA